MCGSGHCTLPASLLAARAGRESQRSEGNVQWQVSSMRAATEGGGASAVVVVVCIGDAGGGGGRAAYSLFEHLLLSGLMPTNSSTSKGRDRERVGRSSKSPPDRFELSSSSA